MTSRIGSPDTQADLDVRACLDAMPPRSFVMVAGAGSGKTTSLIKAIAHLADTKGTALRRAGRQIACITYTDVAVGEIAGDVGTSPLFHISTIHSFLWSVIRPFHSDIADWVKQRIEEKIAEKREHHDRPKTQARTKIKLVSEIADLETDYHSISALERFTYGTGSDYAGGILGHDDILKLTPVCIAKHRLLRQLIAARFPFIFVDESQDTNRQVVDALRAIADENSEICVGFFGDPMQKIYTTGEGAIALGDGWKAVTKPENFRCPTSVLSVINAIRAQDDQLEQTRGRTEWRDGKEQPVIGSANLFILPADNQRTARLAAVRQWLASETNDALWENDGQDGDVRLLILVHRVAAIRLGFPNLFSALNDKKPPQSFKDGLGDGTSWPLRPFSTQILPLVVAAQASDSFAAMTIVRRASPLLERERLRGQDVREVLAALQAATAILVDLLTEGSKASVREVLKHIQESELFRLDDRYRTHLVPGPVDDGSSGFLHVQAFLDCAASELWSWWRYVQKESPFATQHGIKGAQFERVLVVIDDEEAAYSLYSYGKYFGFALLSETDQANIAAGEESVLDRTRRLFYVCCSRALKDLAVVVFASDVAHARAAIVEQNLFPEAAIRDAVELC